MFLRWIPAALLVLTACRAPAPAAPDAQVTKPEAQVAQENEAAYVTAIRFHKGNSALPKDAKEQLDAAIAKARAAGVIDQIKVITWADGDYPSEGAQLSRPQRELAERRNQTIQDYLMTRTRGVDIDTYNMAERPEIFQGLLATGDARMKRSLEEAGIATTANDQRFPKNASKSVVMIVLGARRTQ